MHKLRASLIVLISTFLLLLSTNAGFALVARKGDSITISSDEVINEDLYLAGDIIIMDGTVNGDLWVVGGTITIRGRVRDSVFAAGRKVTVLGNVGHGIKAGGQTVTIGGNVTGDLVLAGSDISIDRDANIEGDFLFGGREILIDGPIEGYILGGGSMVIINSSVQENVRLGVKNLTLTKAARIGGNLTYYSENEATIQPGAQIVGSTTHHFPEYRNEIKKIFPFVLLAGIVGKIVGFFMSLIVGLAFILFAPKWMESMADSIQKKTGVSAGWGAVILFAVPVGIVIAMTTVVGIQLATITLFLYLVAISISQIAVSLFIGRLIIGQGKSIETKALMFGAFALGLFIIRLIRFIPVAGLIVWLVAILFGLGAMVVAEGARRAEARKATSPLN